MTKIEQYRLALRELDDWQPYLLAESGLPGPRGNIELAQAAALEGNLEFFERCLRHHPGLAPTGSPYEFLAFCGVLGLGVLLARGEWKHLDSLREHARDPRWRVREAVAMALQKLGANDMNRLLDEMEDWAAGTALEQRAAAAALCEPGLLGESGHARRTLQVLDRITASIDSRQDRRSEEFQALRKGLGYCWSVAVAALPAEGRVLMEKWLASPDADIRWIMKENLKKKRLERADPSWVRDWRLRTGGK